MTCLHSDAYIYVPMHTHTHTYTQRDLYYTHSFSFSVSAPPPPPPPTPTSCFLSLSLSLSLWNWGSVLRLKVSGTKIKKLYLTWLNLKNKDQKGGGKTFLWILNSQYYFAPRLWNAVRARCYCARSNAWRSWTTWRKSPLCTKPLVKTRTALFTLICITLSQHFKDE